MKRADYVALFDRIDSAGEDSRLHWATGPRAGQIEPWTPDAGRPGSPVRGLGEACREDAGEIVFTETLLGAPRLVLAGAGHVGVAVAQLAVMLGFRTTVIDERPEFATPERLPGVDQIICADYASAFEQVPHYGNCYYVLVTPGHRMDRECAYAALTRPAAYVGMIGSRGKVATTKKALAELGVTEERLDTLRSPIGLDLGGREPAEVAVSIAAEIIQVRAARGGQHFDPRVHDAIAGLVAEPERPAVLATIIGSGGSVPRDASSRMLVTADGIVGSVGGGAIEAASITRATELLDAGAPAVDVADYVLSNAQGAELGMICGGQVKVLFERL